MLQPNLQLLLWPLGIHGAMPSFIPLLHINVFIVDWFSGDALRVPLWTCSGVCSFDRVTYNIVSTVRVILQ